MGWQGNRRPITRQQVRHTKVDAEQLELIQVLMPGYYPGRSVDLTGIRLWGKAYLLTERNAVRDRTWRYVLVLLKRRGASLARTGGLAAPQRQLQHAAWCQFSEIHG